MITLGLTCCDKNSRIIAATREGGGLGESSIGLFKKRFDAKMYFWTAMFKGTFRQSRIFRFLLMPYKRVSGVKKHLAKQNFVQKLTF